MPSRTLSHSVTPQEDGCSVRDILRQMGVSLGLMRSLKRVENGITLDGVHARTVDLVHTGQTVAVHLPEDERPAAPCALQAAVVYEDDDVIVFDKPAGMTIHPVRDHRTDTLANCYAWHLSQKGESGAFRPVNRLDRNTSGLAVVAKHRLAASRLNGRVEKVYYAVCTGRIDPPSGTVDAPIRRREGFGISREVGEGGESAVTHYETVCACDAASLLRVVIDTGRMHQIRVHLSYLGHPLYGDDFYGGDTSLISRHALHCGQVSFLHPVTGRRVTCKTPFPADFEALTANFFAKPENIS